MLIPCLHVYAHFGVCIPVFTLSTSDCLLIPPGAPISVYPSRLSYVPVHIAPRFHVPCMCHHSNALPVARVSRVCAACDHADLESAFFLLVGDGLLLLRVHPSLV